MSEIIITLPYKEINMTRSCIHCGSYDVAEKVEIGRPTTRTTDQIRQGSTIIKKTKMINIPAYLCQKCLGESKWKRKIYSFSSLAFFVTFLIIAWTYAMPGIYDLSQQYKGHIGGLVFFIMGLVSIFLFFFSFIFPASMMNRFNGIQLLSYNPHRIIIRFYNEDLANKFIDLNNVTEDQIKRK